MSDDPGRAPVPIERLAAELRRLYLRLGGDRTDATAATWSRQSPEEWAANLQEFDRALVAACRAVGVAGALPATGAALGGPERAQLIEALAGAGMDVRVG